MEFPTSPIVDISVYKRDLTVVKFDGRYYTPILEGEKNSTIRNHSKGIDIGDLFVGEFKIEVPTYPNSTTVNRITSHTSKVKHLLLFCTGVVRKPFYKLDKWDTYMEGRHWSLSKKASVVEHMKESILDIYPDLNYNSEMYIYYFDVVKNIQSMILNNGAKREGER